MRGGTAAKGGPRGTKWSPLQAWYAGMCAHKSEQEFRFYVHRAWIGRCSPSSKRRLLVGRTRNEVLKKAAHTCVVVDSRWCSAWFRAFLVAASPATAMALAGCGAYPPAWVTASNDEGGLLGKYVEKYRIMAARGDTLVVDGPCNSACTLALGMIDVCVTSRASFGFHMAQTLTPIGYFPSDYWSRYMMAYYPPEIREWIISKGGLTPEMKILHGEELAALIPRCPWETRAEDSVVAPERPDTFNGVP